MNVRRHRTGASRLTRQGLEADQRQELGPTRDQPKEGPHAVAAIGDECGASSSSAGGCRVVPRRRPA